jgi:hypothetical protein
MNAQRAPFTLPEDERHHDDSHETFIRDYLAKGTGRASLRVDKAGGVGPPDDRQWTPYEINRVRARWEKRYTGNRADDVHPGKTFSFAVGIVLGAMGTWLALWLGGSLA